MRITFSRKARYMKLGKGELEIAIAALAAYRAQVVQDGLKAASEPEFVSQAGLHTAVSALRGRLILKSRSL
jgi:hypothetical protein